MVLMLVLCCTAALVGAASERTEWDPVDDEHLWKMLDDAEDGDAEAQNGLGLLYAAGNSVDRNYGKAVEWFQKAVDQDHTEAFYNLGACYGSGLGVETDVDEAGRLFEKAAERGHGRAAFALGSLYHTDNLIGGKDLKKTLKWYQKSAEAGEEDGLYNLGTLYFNGEGVKQDEARALKLWSKASKKGHKTAAFSIFEVLELGTKFTEKDPKKAQEWLMKAAENGHPKALTQAGQRLVGMGNMPKAIEYLRGAAEAGEANAMFYLGVLLTEGRAEMRTKDEAWKLWEGAAEAGNEVAKRVIENAGSAVRKSIETKNTYLETAVSEMKQHKRGKA